MVARRPADIVVTLLLLLSLVVATAAHAAGADQSCPAGQSWDAAMAMCMPATTTTTAAAAATATITPSCPAGSAWDEPMAMCMPVAHAKPSFGGVSNADAYDAMTSPDRCGARSYFHFGMAMCLSMPRQRGRFTAMVMGNVFLTDVGVSGRESTHKLSAPNWLMADVGVDLASWNRLELDVMLTAELWTTPQNGYPEPLQIGEENRYGVPFIDSQHPHSSPIMGLTLTDVIALSRTKTRLLRVFFSPRGESTDGPTAFMHRPSATINPDAPLGHHIGQDVGHVTSTVIGASLYIDHTLIEASTFSGLEPDPTSVDLPVRKPDSAAVRLAQHFTPHLSAAVSGAYINNPEGNIAIPHEWRASASVYLQYTLPHQWRTHVAGVWGLVTGYDYARALNSFLGEAVFSDDSNSFWSRVEVLQRTPYELEISSNTPNSGRWVGAGTLGYTRRIVSVWGFDFSVGGSGTLSVVPDSFDSRYGGQTIWSGKLFVEARFYRMFSAGHH